MNKFWDNSCERLLPKKGLCPPNISRTPSKDAAFDTNSAMIAFEEIMGKKPAVEAYPTASAGLWNQTRNL
jgi:hypothetical protein